MSRSTQPISVNECKIQAALLLKSFRSDDINQRKKAIKRFARLHDFKNTPMSEIAALPLKLKHALAVIAFEKGFSSWQELKCQIPFIRGGFLNHWFANIADAETYLSTHHGFLLPYQKQFFICDAEYINAIGMDAADPDWRLINFNWANPANQSAWKRLYKKWGAR